MRNEAIVLKYLHYNGFAEQIISMQIHLRVISFYVLAFVMLLNSDGWGREGEREQHKHPCERETSKISCLSLCTLTAPQQEEPAT